MIGKALAVWAAILPIAIANGAWRQAFLVPKLGPKTGKRVSGFALSTLVFAVALLTVRWMGVANAASALGVGLLWLTWTMTFEFVFGHWVARKSWSVLLQAYTFKDGELWPVVLVALAMSPYIACLFLKVA
jgi:hypothetical protein